MFKTETIPQRRQNARNGRHAAERYQGSEHNDVLTHKNTEIFCLLIIMKNNSTKNVVYM